MTGGVSTGHAFVLRNPEVVLPQEATPVNIHLRKNKWSVVWQLEIYYKGRRLKRTVDAAPGTKPGDKPPREVVELWYRLRDQVRQEVEQHRQPSRQPVGQYLATWWERHRAD